jgi:hypothetical protein
LMEGMVGGFWCGVCRWVRWVGSDDDRRLESDKAKRGVQVQNSVVLAVGLVCR